MVLNFSILSQCFIFNNILFRHLLLRAKKKMLIERANAVSYLNFKTSRSKKKQTNQNKKQLNS